MKYKEGRWTQSTCTKGTTADDWTRNFGPKKRMQCSAQCGSHEFTQRKWRKAWTTAYAFGKSGGAEEWVCKRCGAPVTEVPDDRQISND